MSTKKKAKTPAMPKPSYYAFGQKADRLIQIELRADGRVRVLHRKNSKGAWATVKSTDFKAAVDAAQPINFTVAAANRSWALVEMGPPEWIDDPYDYDGVQILNMSLPFGSDVDWGAGNRKPNAKFFSAMKFGFKDGVLTHGDQTERKSSVTTVDLKKCFAAPGQTPRYLVVLRVAPGNKGGVRFENIVDADQLAYDV